MKLPDGNSYPSGRVTSTMQNKDAVFETVDRRLISALEINEVVSHLSAALWLLQE